MGWNDDTDEKQEGKEKGSKYRQTETEGHSNRSSLGVAEEEQVQYVYIFVNVGKITEKKCYNGLQ